MLRTNSYFDKNYNETKSVVALAQIDTTNNKVTMHIGISREAIQENKIIESRTYFVDFNRNGNLFEQAYAAVKAPTKYIKFDKELGKAVEVIEPSFFANWQDYKV